MDFTRVVAMVLVFLAVCTSSQSLALAGPTAIVSGRVVDAAGSPLAGVAIVVAIGDARGATTSSRDGTFAVEVPAGIGHVSARLSGYRGADATDVALVAGERTNITLTLAETTSSTVAVIGRTRANGSSATVRDVLGAGTTLDAASLQTFPETNLIETLPAQVPGVALARVNSATPNNFFAVRGGFYETRVAIDGHSLSPGSFGNWNANYANPYTFSSVEVLRGPGTFSSNAGESAFGTINLRTPDVPSIGSFKAITGVDGQGGSFSSLSAGGPLTRDGKLGFFVMHNVTGYNGANQNYVAARPNATNTLVNYVASFSSPYLLRSEVVKARYRFSPATSLTASFIGLQGQYAPQGGAYGAFQQTIVVPPCKPDPANCGLFSTYNSPDARGLIGQPVDLWAFSSQSTLINNQPLFEAELRTVLRGGSLLIRPYVSTLSRYIDGMQRRMQPGFSGSWFLVSNGANCQAVGSAPNVATQTPAKGPCFQQSGTVPVSDPKQCTKATPCYTPSMVTANDGSSGYAAPFAQLEVDRLRGTTVTYLVSAGPNVYALSFDQRSDDTSSYGGDTTPLPKGTPVTLATTAQSILPTISRNRDLSLAGELALGPMTRLSASLYYTRWHLDYQFEDPVLFSRLQRNAPLALIHDARDTAHVDPQLGIVIRPNRDLALRFSGGSAITVPFASQVSGLPGLDFPNGSNNFIGTVTLRNPNLRPETTVAYNAGGDMRLPDGGVLSLDLFDNTVHDAFITAKVPYTGTPISGGGTFLQSTTINGPLLRSYGIELGLSSRPAFGWGYRGNLSLQRAFYDQLPRSLYLAQQLPIINGKQLDGTPAVIPYSSAYGELRYAARHETLVALGVHYLGANNAYFGPARTIANVSVRSRLGAGTLGFTVDNLTNTGNGTALGQGIANAGFAQVTYGAPTAGKPFRYGEIPTSLQTIPSRLVRVQYTLSGTAGR